MVKPNSSSRVTRELMFDNNGLHKRFSISTKMPKQVKKTTPELEAGEGSESSKDITEGVRHRGPPEINEPPREPPLELCVEPKLQNATGGGLSFDGFLIRLAKTRMAMRILLEMFIICVIVYCIFCYLDKVLLL